MPTTRDIRRGLRAVASLLLVFAVLFGPAGLGGVSAFASPSACGVFCPCDSADVDSEGERARTTSDVDVGQRSAAASQPSANTSEDGSRADAEREDRRPCEDECPDDCPNCGCHLSAVMAVLPSALAAGAAAYIADRTMNRPSAPPSGERGSVFRPPRAR